MCSGKSKWGLSKWGLKVLVHNCPRLPTILSILRRKFPLERGPKGPRKCTTVDDCAQIAESGLKPPFKGPHLGFPDVWGGGKLDKQSQAIFYFKLLGQLDPPMFCNSWVDMLQSLGDPARGMIRLFRVGF